MNLIDQQINDFLEDYREAIIKEANAQGRNKSGKIGESLEIIFDEKSHKLLGFKWIGQAWEYGRGKTVNTGGDGAVKRAITRWVESNNIQPRDNISKESMIYLITRMIHKKGTVLRRARVHSGVLTNFLTENRINMLTEKIGAKLESEVINII